MHIQYQQMSWDIRDFEIQLRNELVFCGRYFCDIKSYILSSVIYEYLLCNKYLVLLR